MEPLPCRESALLYVPVTAVPVCSMYRVVATAASVPEVHVAFQEPAKEGAAVAVAAEVCGAVVAGCAVGVAVVPVPVDDVHPAVITTMQVMTARRTRTVCFICRSLSVCHEGSFKAAEVSPVIINIPGHKLDSGLIMVRIFQKRCIAVLGVPGFLIEYKFSFSEYPG
jgi:hypothetical protein